MPTEHIYDGAHSISSSVLRAYGPQRHIFFTTEQNVSGCENCPKEIRTYSSKNFKKVESLLKKMHQEEQQLNGIYKIASIFNSVDELVIKRERAVIVDGDCSEGHHEFYHPNKSQLTNLVNSISPYFTGISQLDLYAAVSGRKSDIEFANRTLTKKSIELDKKIIAMHQNIDNTYHQIMAIPLNSQTPSPPTLRILKNLRLGLFKRILKRFCA